MIDGCLEGVDLFCGAGGFTAAAERAGVRVRLAINHWDVAMDTHQANNPNTRHIRAEMIHVDVDHRIPQFNVLFAGVSCTDHSNAKGSATVSDQKRADAWYVHKFAKARRPPWILVENVREFVDWCRTKFKRDKNGNKIWNKKIQNYERVRDLRYRGEYFRKWIAEMERLGYRWELKLINCADTGAAQSRTRLFIIFRLQTGHARDAIIPWPEPTHGKHGGMLTIEDRESPIVRCKRLKRWRGAREIIDFSKPIRSVFGRRTKTGKLDPLAPKTLNRLEVGLIKFNAPQMTDLLWKPAGFTSEVNDSGSGIVYPTGNEFLAVLKGTSTVASIELPLPTITASVRHLGLSKPTALIQPFLSKYHGSGKQRFQSRTHGLELPLPTVDTQPRFGLAVPYVMQAMGSGLGDDRYQASWSIDEPMRTVLAHRTIHGVAVPYSIDQSHSRDADRSHSLRRPLRTVTGCESLCLGVPFLLPRPGQFDHWALKRCRSIDEPLNTVIAHHATSYVAVPTVISNAGAYLIDVNHGDGGGRSGGRVFAGWQPLTTVCGKRHHGLIVPFYSTGVADHLDEPLATVTTRDRHGLLLFDAEAPAEKSRSQRQLVILNKHEARLFSTMLLLGIGDLGFRMLAIDELLAAQGFPRDYVLFGTREEQVKQVGNAVEHHVGVALFSAIREEQQRTMAVAA